MTAFVPIAPMKAVEIAEAAGVPDPRQFIADFAAAGLLKSYALMIETVQPSGDRKQVRGGAIPPELWQRMLGEGTVGAAWTGGTVRLTGSGEMPAVSITGIGFGEDQLRQLVSRYGQIADPQPANPVKPVRATRMEEAPPETLAALAKRPERRTPPAASQKPEPMLVTVKQAMAMLGLGRTKINELMNSGRLVRRRIDGGVRIEVESIRALASSPGQARPSLLSPP